MKKNDYYYYEEKQKDEIEYLKNRLSFIMIRKDGK